MIKDARTCRPYSYWFLEKNKYTDEIKWGVGRYSPELYIQGEEKYLKKIVNCFNKTVCK